MKQMGIWGNDGHYDKWAFGGYREFQVMDIWGKLAPEQMEIGTRANGPNSSWDF